MSNSTSSASNQKNRYEEAIALVKAKELQNSSTFKKSKESLSKNEEKNPNQSQKSYHEPLKNLYHDEKIILNETKKEFKQYLRDKITYQNTEKEKEHLTQENLSLKRYKKDTKLRTKYAQKIFSYLCWFSGGCFLIILLQGFGIFRFQLDKAAITTLIGGFAISVISLVKIILKGLFLPEEKTIIEKIQSHIPPLK